MKARIKSNEKIVEVISRFMPRKRNAASRDWVCNLSDGTCIDESQLEYIEEFIGGLDEAAKEYAKTTFKKPHSDNPDEEVTIVEPDKYAGFIAGAKWDKEQMMKGAMEYEVGMHGEPIKITLDKYVQRAKCIFPGDKVRVIVLPEEE